MSNFVLLKRRTAWLTGMFIAFLNLYAYGQSCNCPSENTCDSCSGGLTSLTLRYNGNFPALIMAIDGDGVQLNLWTSPGEEFTFTGSKKNEKFSGRQINVFINGFFNTSIGTACNDVTMGSNYGWFTAITGTSLGGGPICCAPMTRDNVPPVISNCPSTININLTARECTAIANWTAPIATDNCGLAGFTSNYQSGDRFPAGRTQVKYTAIDSAGNVSNCTFNVVVRDRIDPVFTQCPPDTIIVNADEATCNAIVTWEAPVASDNCGNVTVTSDHSPGEIFPIGITRVRYRATDNAGNRSSCIFYVHVKDKSAPAFMSCPADIVVTENSECSRKIEWDDPEISDCNHYSLKSTHQPGDRFSAGNTTVTYTATDEAGNTSTCSFNVRIVRDELPSLTSCPTDTVVEADETGYVSVNWNEPGASVACGSVSLSSSHKPGDSFPLGETTIRYEATDDYGNKTTCSFNITVIYETISFTASGLITPDGDGNNDQWILTDIERYGDNRVTIVDRWGSVIFNAEGYNNEDVVWRGENMRGVLVPTGTYFYTIEVRLGPSRVDKKGFIELVR